MLFLSCGEASGDILAARLVCSLRDAGWRGEMWGMPGPRSAAEGVSAYWDWKSLHLMGIGEVLPAIPRLLRMADDMAKMVAARNPAGVVLVDSPDFHLPFARRLRREGYGGKIVVLAPPTVWAWRARRARTLAAVDALVLPLFDFEEIPLRAMGVRTLFCGHPLLDELLPVTRDVAAPPRRIGLFPGSRGGEIRRLLPLMAEVARELPSLGMNGVLSISPDLPERARRDIADVAESVKVETWEGSGRDLLGSVDAAVGACGTLAVEALLLDRFLIVVYKMSTSSLLAFKLLVRTPFVAVPNLLCGPVFPELLQRAASVGNVLLHLGSYAGDVARRMRLHERMRAPRARLGSAGVGKRWARAVLQEIGA